MILDGPSESLIMSPENHPSGLESPSDSDSFLETQHQLSHPQTPWPWIVSTIVLSVLSIALFFKPYIEKPCPTSQEVWRRSDLGKSIFLQKRRDFQLIQHHPIAAARKIIKTQDVQFTGNSAFDDNGRFFVPNPSPVDYVGATPETDAAWKNLTLDGRT